METECTGNALTGFCYREDRNGVIITVGAWAEGRWCGVVVCFKDGNNSIMFSCGRNNLVDCVTC